MPEFLLALGLVATSCGSDDAEPAASTVAPTDESEVADPDRNENADASATGDEAEATADNSEDENATSDDDRDDTAEELAADETSAVGSAEPAVDRLLNLTDDAETSQIATDSGEAPIAVYDRFDVDEDLELGTVRWEGFYCRLVESGPAPDPTATAFIITIVGGDDEGPDPDDVVAESTVGVAEADETRRAAADRPCGAVSTTVAFYAYEADFEGLVGLTAGRPYWLSIQAVTPDFSTYWGWRGASGDDTTSIRHYGGEPLEVFGDRAFALMPSTGSIRS